MYYNSNQNSNEYYSSYKQELAEVTPNNRSKNTLPLPIKITIGMLLLGVIGFTAPHLVKYFSQDDVTLATKEVKDIPTMIISENKLPQSIQLQNAQSKIISNLEKDVSEERKEHNEIKKQVISLPETSNMNSSDIESIINLILAKKREKNASSLEKELLNAELEENTTQTLKESNHYNKVVLSSKNENSENKLIHLNNALEKENTKTKLSKYEKSLKPEIATRANEMRIIIVKRGDSLSKIAQKAYGDIRAYDKIFKANPEIIKNPNQIFIGQKIRIPL